ncbi:hypothetical protein OSTOST_06297 [Ostertagia ostertagi]
MFSRSAIRVASCIVAGRRCLTSFASVPTSSLSRLATPSQSSRVFGPFDPPKQLTFKEVESRVLKAIRAWDRFPADKETLLKIEADFMKDLGFDSLDQGGDYDGNRGRIWLRNSS